MTLKYRRGVVFMGGFLRSSHGSVTITPGCGLSISLPTQLYRNGINQGCITNSTRGQNGVRKDFLGTRHSLISQFVISFIRSASLYCEEHVCVCVCVHISDCLRVVYELPFLPNNNTNETFVHKAGTLRRIVLIFIIGVPAWR